MAQTIKNVKQLKKIKRGKKVCVLGIGNFDRADDYAGGAVIDEMQNYSFPDNIVILNSGPVPEAFTGVIKREAPDYLIIIDAANMDEPPGTIRVFTERDIEDAFMITPHKTSMKMFTKYLSHYLKNLKTIFIGIEPVSLSYLEEMTPAIRESVIFLAHYLVEFLRKDIDKQRA